LEQGVLFEPVFRHSVNIPRIVGEDFFPPKAEMCNVSVTLLRVSPIDECNVPIKRSGKMMDGGPLGLRGNWLRKDMRYFPGKGFKINHWIDEPYFSSSVNDAYRKGDGISGCLASDGAGFVGPLPERGESVIIKLAGKTFRGRNNSIRIESPWNTECLSGPIAFNDKLSEETVVLKRSRGNRENDQRIGVYTIRIDGEFAYGRSEDENVHDVKPLVWVSSLEVILDQ